MITMKPAHRTGGRLHRFYSRRVSRLLYLHSFFIRIKIGIKRLSPYLNVLQFLIHELAGIIIQWNCRTMFVGIPETEIRPVIVYQQFVRG